MIYAKLIQHRKGLLSTSTMCEYLAHKANLLGMKNSFDAPHWQLSCIPPRANILVQVMIHRRLLINQKPTIYRNLYENTAPGD